MDITENNLPVFASRFYTNTNCADYEEYLKDLRYYKLARKLAKKIGKGRTSSVRLLCNHVTCFTNNFEIEAAKKILLFGASTTEQEVLKTVLNYLGFLEKDELPEVKFSLEAAKALKEMDV